MRISPQIKLPTTVCVLSTFLAVAELHAGSLSWSGRAKYRILVEVPAIDLADRERDVSVASVPIDFPLLLQQQRLSGQFDPSSLHMHQYDSSTGRVLQFEDGRFAADPYDIPCRFDNELSPNSDLSRVGSAIDSDGRTCPKFENAPQVAVVQSRACFHGRKNCLDAYPGGEIKFEVCDLL